MEKREQQTLSPELLQFLSRPESFPHQPDEVEHIQTHISHVFMAGQFVYKLKKPVNLGFLDYSTIEKRRKYCYREVELNRRLSDDIYLGVVVISRRNGGFVIVEKETDFDPGTIAEYAVKMRRLPEQYFLHRYIEENTLRMEHLDRVGEVLASFYLRQRHGEDVTRWGQIEAIKVNTDENFEQTRKFIDQTITRPAFDAIEYYTNAYYKHNADLFRRRVEAGRIVDGHGDLHLEHIHISPEKVQIYDCIEFNERFRYGDLAADLAFLAMDLDYNNCRTEERYFIRQMAARLKDEELMEIINFYKCYRAYVKGKVKSFQSVADDVEPEDRLRNEGTARQYFKLSMRYALLGSAPMVIVVMGRIATGKSTLAAQLSEQLNLYHYSSDRTRKDLAGLPLNKRTAEADREQLYSSHMSEKTYGQLAAKALNSVSEGQGVILDATYGSPEQREALIKRLEEKSAPYVFVEAQADDETVITRLRQREHQERVISDARLEDFEKLNAGYHPPHEMDGGHIVRVNSAQEESVMLKQLFQQLIQLQLQQSEKVTQ